MAKRAIPIPYDGNGIDKEAFRLKAIWFDTNGDFTRWEEVRSGNNEGSTTQYVWWYITTEEGIVKHGFLIDNEDEARKLYLDVALRRWERDSKYKDDIG